MITSFNGIVYAYTFFLIGRGEFGVDADELRDLTARWFFMTTLTARYSTGSESVVEQDLNRLRGIRDALTEDFWTITLPNELATSTARSPSLFAYQAALSLLAARVLFSKMKVTGLLDPALKASRAAIEKHHLFPKSHLRRIGVVEKAEMNQIANFAFVEWGDNSDISDLAPVEYLRRYPDRFAEEMSFWHALPPGWSTMDYPTFLVERRKLIAKTVRAGFGRLSSPA